MKRPTKILILGIGQSNFLDQLYGGIAERTDQFLFDVDGYTEISRGVVDDKKNLYSKHLKFDSYLIPKHKLVIGFLTFALTSFFWQIVFFELSQGESIRQVIHQLKKYTRARYIAANLIQPAGYKVIHFHFCTPDNLAYLHFLSTKDNAICSFWGSDLMRYTGAANVFYVSKALAHAKAITIQSAEMAEMLYCKYGRALHPKVSTLRFTIHTGIYEAIDEQRSTDITAKFKASHSIADDNIIVAVGHNAFEENNHIPILRQMELLPAGWRAKLTFVLHVSYGGDQNYIRRLTDFTKSNTNLDIRMLDQYLGPKEMAEFRTASQLMIHLPVSDALSGAMTEVLYAGNCVLTGSWLPFGILRRNGITYTEVESFSELPVTLIDMLDNLAETKQRNVDNAQRIRSFLFPDTTSKAWINLLNEVANG